MDERLAILPLIIIVMAFGLGFAGGYLARADLQRLRKELDDDAVAEGH